MVQVPYNELRKKPQSALLPLAWYHVRKKLRHILVRHMPVHFFCLKKQTPDDHMRASVIYCTPGIYRKFNYLRIGSLCSTLTLFVSQQLFVSYIWWNLPYRYHVLDLPPGLHYPERVSGAYSTKILHGKQRQLSAIQVPRCLHGK